MSKAMRLERLRQKLAQNTDNFNEVEEELAFQIWFAQKEFNMGAVIDDGYPLMKILSLYEESSLKKYEKIQNAKTPDKSLTMR